jgi:hypothetical protein
VIPSVRCRWEDSFDTLRNSPATLDEPLFQRMHRFDRNPGLRIGRRTVGGGTLQCSLVADGATQLPAKPTAILAGSIIVIIVSLCAGRCLISVFILSALSSDLSVDWSDQTYGLYKKRNRHLSPSRIHDIHSICKRLVDVS